MKKIVYLLLSVIVFISYSQKTKPKLIYIADPLCSWCYGFQLEMDKVLAQYHDSCTVEVIMGGMGIGNIKPLNQELKESLKDHWKEVHKKTGQVFNDKIIHTKGLIYNSEPMCKAVVATKIIDSSKAILMHKSLQTAFYAQNKNVTTFAEIQKVAITLGLDTAVFRKTYFSEEIKKKTIAEFKRVEKNGVDTFPVLILSLKNETILIAEGYASHKVIDKKLKKILKY